MTRIELDDDQKVAVARMVAEPTRAALNGSLYGTGKTVVTVEVAEGIGAQIKLIVCPLFTKYGWENTIKGQYPDAVVKFINSTKDGKQALSDLESGVAGWYIVGRELFSTKSVQDRFVKLAPGVDFMAYDECQRFANHRSMNYRYMKKIKPKYKMALSATPAANKFSGLFAITQWLWPKLEGHQSFWKWVADWCKTEEDFFGGTQVVGEKNPGEFVNVLPCYIRLVKDFGDPVTVTLSVELSAAERKIYNQFQKNLVVFLKEHALIGMPQAKRIRLRQMTLGEVSINPDTDEVYFADDMKSTKFETLVDIIKEYPDEPMVIFTHSQKFARVVTLQLQTLGYKAMEWSGQVSETHRHAIKTLFVADEGIDYIVATPAAIGEGVDGLQHRSRFMVWLSRDDNNMLNEQAFRRLHRRGQTREVVSIDISVHETYDSKQLENLIEQTIKMNRSLKKES